MPHKLRYARQGGFRRQLGTRGPYKSHFGYGGAGYGGFGRKGNYGGWRSHYPYGDPKGMKHVYPRRRAKKASIDDWLPSRAYGDSTTFSFGLILLAIIGIGILFSRRGKSSFNPFV